MKRIGRGSKLDWPAKFARRVMWKGDEWWLVANGPGARSVTPLFAAGPLWARGAPMNVMSVGFCGALDPALRVGDIVVTNDTMLGPPERFHRGEIVSVDRVAATAGEKKALREKTGAIAVDMETEEIRYRSRHTRFACIRVVSDTAAEDMPLDFNLYRDSDGRFSRIRIALAAMARPFTRIPALLKFESNCRVASESLGAFFADCRF
jgi:purine-nucleoside phosphorylase